MELLGSLQSLLGNTLNALITVVSLVIVVILGFYNWLYLSRILKSNDQIGLRPPEHFCHLIRVGIFLPLFTAIFTVIILVARFW